MEKKIWNMMDQFFTIIMLITGDTDQDNMSIHHIL